MEPPLDDSILIHCRGRCGAFIAIPLKDLKNYLKPKDSLKDFCDFFICKRCLRYFAAAIEEIPEIQA